MRTYLLGAVLVAANAMTPALAQPVPQARAIIGQWNYHCKDGKLVAVHVALLVATEILVPVPPDVCEPTRPRGGVVQAEPAKRVYSVVLR